MTQNGRESNRIGLYLKRKLIISIQNNTMTIRIKIAGESRYMYLIKI